MGIQHGCHFVRVGKGEPDNLDSSLDCEYISLSLGSAVLLCKMSVESHLLPGLSVTTQYSIGKLRLRHIWQCGVGWYSGLRWREGLGKPSFLSRKGRVHGATLLL